MLTAIVYIAAVIRLNINFCKIIRIYILCMFVHFVSGTGNLTVKSFPLRFGCCALIGNRIVQGKKIGLADAMCGVQRAVTVRIVSAGEGVAIVDVGEGKWWDKAFGVVFGAVGFWPIIGLAAYGSCRQAAVPGRVHRCIKKYLKETNALEEA